MRNRILVIAVLLLALSMMAGCHLESRNERIAKRALKESYGEEFEVKSIYTDYRKHFYATCAPVNNEDIVFTAKITTSGEILESNYTEAILGSQIREIIYPEINEMWPGAYVNVKQKNLDDYVATSSLKETMEKNKDIPNALVGLFIPRSVSDRWSIEEEYKFWSEDIGQMILQHKIPKLSVGVWILDDDRMSEADEFYKTTEFKITFLENVFGEWDYCFAYDKNTSEMISLKDYKEMRMKNENIY